MKTWMLPTTSLPAKTLRTTSWLNKQPRWFHSGVLTIALTSTLFVNFQSIAAAQPPIAPMAQGLAQKPASRPAARLLPARIANAVLRTHAHQINVPMRSLRIVSSSQEVWSNTCLELQQPGEVCGEAMTNGWRVEVSHGSQRWVYRTDATGKTIRAEAANVRSLPDAVKRTVLSTVAKAQGIPVSQLKLAAARSRTWDGCLGVAGPDQFCSMIAIPGWQVIVAGPEQYWVYHLNQTGSQIKLNPTTSGKGTLVPTFWQLDSNELSAVGDDAVFQSISSGGFAGRTEKTVLFKDGRVLRMSAQPNARFMPVLVRQLSPQQVQQFRQTLQQQEFGDFLGLSYPAPTGAADYFTIALMVPQGATQYVDINQTQTPLKLQQVIQAWNQIAR